VYWVVPAGTASWANCRSQSPLAGAAGCSMATANANAAGGDTVYLRGGTYGTGIAPVKNGTSSARILFKGYTGETPTISCNATAISANGKSYQTFEGLTATGNKVFADLRNANNIWLLNSTLINSSDSTGGWPVGVLMYTNSRYNRVINCIIGNSGYMTYNNDIGGLINIGSWSDSTDSSGFNLLDGNTFYHGGHHIMEIASKYNIIRNNTFHNEDWTACPRPSMGNLCGNRDIIIEDDYDDDYYNVLEGNRIAFSGASIDDATGASGLSVRGPHTMVRNNTVYCNAGPGVSFYADASGSYDPRYEHVFHNTFYKNGISLLSQSDFRYTFGLLFDDVAGNNPAIPIVNAAIKNNLFYQNTGGDMYFYYTSAASQTVLGNYYASASNNSTPMAALAGNTVSTANPLFADIGAQANVSAIMNFDFHLQLASPAIDKGVFLTTATAAGSGTIVAVADAGYFTDGYGITDGDLIQLQGQTETARIVKVDFGANTITVDKTLSWTSGQGIALAYYGTAPDAGAFEYNQGGSVQVDPKMQRSARFKAYMSGRNMIVDATGLRECSSDNIAVRVYDLAGKIAKSLENVREDKLFISSAGLVTGVYAYAVQLNAVSVYSGKIMIP
jgi:hypothetical protein